MEQCAAARVGERDGGPEAEEGKDLEEKGEKEEEGKEEQEQEQEHEWSAGRTKNAPYRQTQIGQREAGAALPARQKLTD